MVLGMADWYRDWCIEAKCAKIRNGWTDKVLAENSKLSESYVCGQLNGKNVSARAIRAISAALGIDAPKELDLETS